MKLNAKILLNGVEVRKKHLTPEWRRVVKIRERRIRRRYKLRRILNTGNLNIYVGMGRFTATISIRTATGTETVPSGASNCQYEVWGAGGGGGGTTGSGCAITAGGGGGGAGMTTSTFGVATKGGLTWSFTAGAVGTAGIAGGANGGVGGTTTLNAGTITGWSNISVAGGNGGTTGGAAGTGGAAPTDANAGAVKTAGNNGSGVNGGASIAGVVTGDGQPGSLYGKGGQGHNAASVGNGVAGNTPAAVFSYTG